LKIANYPQESNMCFARLSLSLLFLCMACRPQWEARENLAPTTADPIQHNLTTTSGSVRSGDTLDKILQSLKLDNGSAQQIIAAFANVYDVRKIQPGRSFALATDSCQTVHEFAYHASPELTIVVKRDSSAAYSAEKKEIPLHIEVVSLSGIIETSLYDAVLRLGETPELIIAFSDIFQWDIDFFTDPRQGDTFQLIYEKISSANDRNTFLRYGRILAGSYTQKDTTYSAFYFENSDAKGGYYDALGRTFQKTFLKSPLNYTRISSHFTGARRHPILKIVRPHYAVDFAAPTGTPVSAAGDGVVIAKGYDKGLGNFIKIQHTNKRYVTRYGHLNGFAPGIEKGKPVQQKQVIGYVGKTGLATGPHLDYAFYDNGRPINPLKIKASSGEPIGEKDRDRFEQLKIGRMAQLHRAALAMEYINIFTTRSATDDTLEIAAGRGPLTAFYK